MAYNKSDLVSKIAQKSNLTKAQAEAAVNAFQDVFVEAMKSGEGLKLTGLFPSVARSSISLSAYLPFVEIFI